LKEKILPFSVEDKMSAYFKVFIFAYVRVHLEGAVIRENNRHEKMRQR
jgi:hypothetical protein